MKHLRGKVSNEMCRIAVAVEEKALSFPDEERCSTNEHMNSYTKLLTDMVNADFEIDEEYKAVILLNSLTKEEYETFTLTLINERKFLNYNEVSTALVNYEVRRQDRLSSSGSTTVEALAIRGKSSNRKGKDD